MKANQVPRDPMQALVKAIFDVRPPVLRGVKIDADLNALEIVRLEVVLTPELVQAWGEHCKEIA